MVETSVLIGSVFVIAILVFSIGMLVLLTYMYLEQKKKERQEQKEQEKPDPFEVPQHIRQRNFDDFIKELLRKGTLQDTDKNYRQLRRQLLEAVNIELQEHKDKNIWRGKI